MARECCICHAKKDKKASQRRIYFFEIPTEKNLYHDWTDSIQKIKHLPYFLPKRRDLVCSKHFDENCLSFDGGRVELKPGSLPTPLNVLKAKQNLIPTTVNEKENQPSSETNVDGTVRSEKRLESGFEMRLNIVSPTSKSEEDLELRLESKSPHKKLETEDCSLLLSPASSLVSRGSLSVETDGSDSSLRDSTPDRTCKALSKVDVVHVDGQAIFSFASPEDLQEYVDYNKPRSGLRRTRKRPSRFLESVELTSLQKKQPTLLQRQCNPSKSVFQSTTQMKIQTSSQYLETASSSKNSLGLEPDGTITADFAVFAVSTLVIVDRTLPPLIPLPNTVLHGGQEQGSFDLEPDDELPDLVRIPGNNGSTILTSYNESENCNDSDQLCKLHNSEAAPGFQENFVSGCDKEATEGGLPEKVADSFVGLSNHNDESKEGVSSDEGLNHHQTSEMSTQQNISMLPKHTNHQEIILGSQEKRGTDTSVSNSGAAACASAVENTSRNVAKKHTHWIMRNAYLRNNQRATNTSKNQELNQQSIEVSNKHGDNALDSMEPPSTQTEEPKIKQDCNVSNTANCTDDLSKIENNTKHHSDSLSSKPLTPLISNSKQPEKEPECEKTKEGPAVKPPPVSKMRKILQDPTFKLDELVNEENSRTGDETIDLTVHANQPTFQLVAWIRFHRTYHAGKMHVRFLTRQNVPVILIMPPNNIVASGISRDIKDLTKETSVPKVVKDLLNPSVPPQETSLYAVLFCDGFKWELVGSICYRTSSMQATSKASQIQTQTSRETDSVTLQEGSTPASNHLTPVPPNVSSEKPLPDPPSMNSCDVPDPATTTEASSQDQPKNSSNTGSSLNNIENGSTSTVETLLPTEDLAAPASSEVSGLQAPVGSCPPADLKTSPSLSSQNILGIRIKTENIEPEEYPEELYDSDDFYDSDDTDDMEDFESVENISETRKKEWELSDDDVEEDFENLDPEALEKRQREIEEKLARLNSKLSLNLSKVGAHDQGGTPSSIVDENSTIGSQDQSPSSSSSKCPSIATTSAITEMTQPPLKSQPEQKIAAPLSSTNGCQTQTVNLNLTEDSLPSAPDTMLAKYPPGSCDSVLGKETRAHSSKSPERQSSTVELCPRLSSPSRECFVSNLPDETDKGNGSALDTSQPRNTSPLPERASTPNPKLSPRNTPRSRPSSNNTSSNDSRQPSPCRANKEKQPESQATKLSNASLPQLLRATTLTSNKRTPRALAINPPTLLLGNKIVNAKLVVFPKIVAVTPGSVQTKDNEPTVVLSIKVEFEALTGEHKAFCPLRTSATLPLQDLGDKWCMVAVDPLPKAGLAIPGMNMLITHLAIEKALSAAVQHKVPSIFPIRFQGLPTKPALKKKFGVYAFPELPRHVFIGPFSSDSFQDGHPLPIYLKVISSLSTFESPAEVAEKKRVDELKAKLLSYNVNFNPDLVIEPVRPNNKRSNTEETLCVNNRKKPREDVEISVIDNVVPNSVCHST